MEFYLFPTTIPEELYKGWKPLFHSNSTFSLILFPRVRGREEGRRKEERERRRRRRRGREEEIVAKEALERGEDDEMTSNEAPQKVHTHIYRW